MFSFIRVAAVMVSFHGNRTLAKTRGMLDFPTPQNSTCHLKSQINENVRNRDLNRGLSSSVIQGSVAPKWTLRTTVMFLLPTVGMKYLHRLWVAYKSPLTLEETSADCR